MRKDDPPDDRSKVNHSTLDSCDQRAFDADKFSVAVSPKALAAEISICAAAKPRQNAFGRVKRLAADIPTGVTDPPLRPVSASQR